MLSNHKRITRRIVPLLVVTFAITFGNSCSDDTTSPGDFDAPTGLTAEATAYNRIRLQWAHVEGAPGYFIERRQDLTGQFSRLAEVNAPPNGTVTYTDNTVAPETFYGYRVRTLGRVGATSSPSDVAGAKTPSQPGIRVSVTMNAPDPAGADGNGFRVRLSGNGTTMTENIAAGESALITPLSGGTYTVTLEDVAPTCGVQGGATRTPTVTSQGSETIATVSFTVICRDSSKGGIVILLTATGDTSDTNGAIARVVGTAGGASVIQDTLAVQPGQTAATKKLEFLTLAPGSYEVSLLDVDASICTLTGSLNTTREVSAARNDTVRFTITCSKNRLPLARTNGPYTGLVNTSINFSATGSADPDGTIVNYTWSFGDGTTGTGPNPTHAYATAGTFVVKLTVTDDGSDAHTDSTTVTVTDAFAWKNRFSDDSTRAGSTVLLHVTTKASVLLTAASGRIAYPSAGLRLDSVVPEPRWTSFSRAGTTVGSAAFQAAVTAPISTSAETPIATLHFTVIGAAGVSSATLTSSVQLRDGAGSTVSPGGLKVIEDTVLVAAGGNRPPTAKVNPTVTRGATGIALVVTSQPGTSDPDGSIASYLWSFGDGTTAPGPIAQKTYDVPGTYVIKLTVTDHGGATAIDSVLMPVEQAPNSVPVANAGGPYSALDGSTVAFDASRSTDADGQIVRYDWQFGDGSTVSMTSPTVFHQYASAGTYIAGVTVLDNRGGVSFDTALVTITPAPVGKTPPVVEANGPYSGIVGLPVALSAAGTTDSNNDIKSYIWYYPDQTTTSGFHTTKIFSTPGVHTVMLVVTDSTGLVDTDDAAVVVTGAGQINEAPIAEANGPYTARKGLPIAFSSQGTRDPDGLVVSYKWDFGDGTVSTDTTASSPVHVYNATGSYAVSLVVRDNLGAAAVDATAVTVLEGIPPVAHSGGPYNGTVNNDVTFSSALSVDVDGTINSYTWNFGDHTATATGQTVAHAYAAPGSYTVKLTVTDNHGYSDSHTSTVTITGLAENVLPVAKANGPYRGSVNIPTTFSSAGSNDPDGVIASYAWNFGDNSTAAGAVATHAYAAEGVYQLVLTVVDDRGGAHSDITFVTVGASPQNLPPVAEANGSYSGAAGSPISFTATGSVDSDGTIVSYLWTFGDGASANGADVTHTYANAGAYITRLTVIDNQGATGHDSAAVTINGPDNANPIAETNGPYSGAVNSPISFSSVGSADPDGTIASHAWTFGDGATANTAHPIHTYTSEGTFEVILTVTDNIGATATDTTQATVAAAGNTPPTANPGGPYSGVVGSVISVTGSGTDDGSIAAYAWDLDNDGAFDDANTASTSFTCTAAGTFTVRLEVRDNGTPPLSSTASTTVTCTSGSPTQPTINARWVNAQGALVTSVTAGATVYLEIDIILPTGQNIHDFQGLVQYSAARLIPAGPGSDLNCSNPGGQTNCPSGSPPSGNTDVLSQYTGNQNAGSGQFGFLNFSVQPDRDAGIGIQGLARLQFTAGSAGSVTTQLVVVYAADGSESTLIPENTQVQLPGLTVN